MFEDQIPLKFCIRRKALSSFITDSNFKDVGFSRICLTEYVLFKIWVMRILDSSCSQFHSSITDSLHCVPFSSIDKLKLCSNHFEQNLKALFSHDNIIEMFRSSLCQILCQGSLKFIIITTLVQVKLLRKFPNLNPIFIYRGSKIWKS